MDNKLCDLIGSVYDTALEPGGWPAFLEKLADAIEGEGTVLVSRHLPTTDTRIHASVRINPTVVSLYETRYASQDIRVQAGGRFCQVGRVFGRPFANCSREELLRSRFYNEFMRPNNILYDLVGLIASHNGCLSVICSMRSPAHSAFGESEASWMRLLIPHLRRAIQLEHFVSDLRMRAAASESALDQWRLGWMLVDAHGGVMLSNRFARCLLARGDGLAITHGKLSAAVLSQTARLQTVISRVAKAHGSTIATAIHISRAQGEPLSLLIATADRLSCSLPASRSCAAIFISDPHAAPPRAFEEVVRQLYGLTPAETKFAAQLLRGQDVRGAGEALHISFHTSRDYMKHMFEKTGVNRQADLVRLLLLSAAQVDASFPDS